MAKRNDAETEKQIKAIEGEVRVVVGTETALTKELTVLETELRELDPRFQKFIEKQSELRVVQSKNQDAWKHIKDQMEANGIKTIKGDWGSITVAERLEWDYDPSLLPAKFFKKVVDTKRLTDTYKLEGKAPKAAFPRYIKYLVKKIK